MSVHDFRMEPEGEVELVNVTLFSEGLYRLSVDIPKATYESVRTIAAETGDDPVDRLFNMARRHYRSITRTRSRSNIRSSRLSI